MGQRLEATSWSNAANSAGRSCSARRRRAWRRLVTSRSRRRPPGPRAGEELRREERVAEEHLLERDHHGERAGQEVAVGDAVVPLAQPLEDGHDLLVLADEAGVGRGQVIDGPQGPRQLTRRADAADVEIVGARRADVLQDAQLLGAVPHVLLPRVRAHVEAVVDGRAARVDEALPQAVARRPPVLRDGEGDEVPAPVPALSLAVLAVRQLVALERAEPQVVAERGGAERGGAPGAFADEQALGDQAAQARADLLAGLAAGVGDVVELGGIDRSVGSGHPEHQHPGRNFDGRYAHDRHRPRPGAARQPASWSQRAAGAGTVPDGPLAPRGAPRWPTMN